MARGDDTRDRPATTVIPVGCGRLSVPQLPSLHSTEAELWLGWTARGLTHLLWSELDAPRPIEIAADVPRSEVPSEFARVLRSYFEGAPVDPVDLPVDLGGTPFQRRVWEALRRIPRGSVRSYAGIAAEVGSPRAMRAVGMANASNPIAIVVPCHRVIEKNRGLGGYSFGLRYKRHLLALEGVDVRADKVLAGQLALI